MATKRFSHVYFQYVLLRASCLFFITIITVSDFHCHEAESLYTYHFRRGPEVEVYHECDYGLFPFRKSDLGGEKKLIQMLIRGFSKYNSSVLNI